MDNFSENNVLGKNKKCRQKQNHVQGICLAVSGVHKSQVLENIFQVGSQ
jgi:hypothetical protein